MSNAKVNGEVCWPDTFLPKFSFVTEVIYGIYYPDWQTPGKIQKAQHPKYCDKKKNEEISPSKNNKNNDNSSSQKCRQWIILSTIF